MSAGSRRKRGTSATRSAEVTSAHAAPNGSTASVEELSRERLLAKYQELCAKYQALVHRYEEQTAERSGAVSLALTAMRTSSTGLALFVGDHIAAKNPQFDELDRAQGEWRRMNAEDAPPVPTLRDLAVSEGGALLASGRAREAVGRYQHSPSGRIVDVHVERGGRDRTVAVIVHDATERYRGERELQATREAAFEHQRMRTVGELASGVAHDLNNVLHAMSMRLTALRRSSPLDKDAARHLDSLGQIVRDVAVRIGRLQEFARQRYDAPQESVDIAAVARDAAALARPEVEATSQRDGKQISIDVALDELPPVTGVAAELRHVFLNLILNARDAMPDGGAIRVAGRVEGGHVVIAVADEGSGIAPENLPRIFDPFFTTKAAKGTGLGLAVAYGVMRRLGGSISAANGERRGAVFTLSFPIAPSRQEQPVPATTADPPVAPGRRVLVVDDDPDNLEAMRFVLEDLGQEVGTARSGDEAVALFSSGERYDLVLCDLGMPGMNGWQTARAIRAIAPATRIEMLTGWAQEIAPGDPLRQLVDGIHAKPLPVGELHRLLTTSTALSP